MDGQPKSNVLSQVLRRLCHNDTYASILIINIKKGKHCYGTYCINGTINNNKNTINNTKNLHNTSDADILHFIYEPNFNVCPSNCDGFKLVHIKLLDIYNTDVSALCHIIAYYGWCQVLSFIIPMIEFLRLVHKCSPSEEEYNNISVNWVTDLYVSPGRSNHSIKF